MDSLWNTLTQFVQTKIGMISLGLIAGSSSILYWTKPTDDSFYDFVDDALAYAPDLPAITTTNVYDCYLFKIGRVDFDDNGNQKWIGILFKWRF